MFLRINILKGNYDLEFPEEKLGRSQKPYVVGSRGRGGVDIFWNIHVTITISTSEKNSVDKEQQYIF